MIRVLVVNVDESTYDALTSTEFDVVEETSGRPTALVIDVSRATQVEIENAQLRWSMVPIVIYVGDEISSEDRIKLYGFVKGYVVKQPDQPYGEEVVALIRALVSLLNPTQFTWGDTIDIVEGLSLDTMRSSLLVRGNESHLTDVECKLTIALLEHKGEPVESDTIIARVWGPGSPTDRNKLRVHICRLRVKMGVPADDQTILTTVRGYGYKIN